MKPRKNPVRVVRVATELGSMFVAQVVSVTLWRTSYSRASDYCQRNFVKI